MRIYNRTSYGEKEILPSKEALFLLKIEQYCKTANLLEILGHPH
jgi:hypothetical protein